MKSNTPECEKYVKEQRPLYFQEACGTLEEKLYHFPKFVSRQALSLFLYKYELFKLVQNVHGSIVECGVHFAGGTMAFAQISSILEPYNYQRRIIGFDTFSGFPEVTDEDHTTERGKNAAYVGAFNVDESNIERDIHKSVELYDLNRPLGHVNKVSFVKGDINQTLPNYLEQNQHLIISLLYLDMDIYKPTKTALEQLISRVPKGGIIAFDEVNNPDWPGETQALVETLGINNVRLQKFPFEPVRSFFVVE